jgi:tRNA threonylcarbamoyladenosine modification (KEOPS) complex  Pcc1 subunit
VTDNAEWHATIRVRRSTQSDAERVAQALAPEATREVPRARAQLARPDPRSVEIRITAADTSACRAALNTYLAWVGLVLSTERAAAQPAAPPNPRR